MTGIFKLHRITKNNFNNSDRGRSRLHGSFLKNINKISVLQSLQEVIK